MGSVYRSPSSSKPIVLPSGETSSESHVASSVVNSIFRSGLRVRPFFFSSFFVSFFSSFFSAGLGGSWGCATGAHRSPTKTKPITLCSALFVDTIFPLTLRMSCLRISFGDEKGATCHPDRARLSAAVRTFPFRCRHRDVRDGRLVDLLFQCRSVLVEHPPSLSTR